MQIDSVIKNIKIFSTIGESIKNGFRLCIRDAQIGEKALALYFAKRGVCVTSDVVEQSALRRALTTLGKKVSVLSYGMTSPIFSTRHSNDDMQMSLLSSTQSPVIDKLKEADLNTLTPIEAMNLLYELKSMI